MDHEKSLNLSALSFAILFSSSVWVMMAGYSLTVQFSFMGLTLLSIIISVIVFCHTLIQDSRAKKQRELEEEETTP